MSQPVPFIIIAQPRTGSTLIASLLHSYPGIRVLVEPLNVSGHTHHMQPIPESRGLIPEALIRRDLDGVLDLIMAADQVPIPTIQTRRVATVAAGFKTMIHQIDALGDLIGRFWSYLIVHRVKVILVFRRNLLLQYISDLIVMQTQQAACWDGQVKTARVEVPIDCLRPAIEALRDQKAMMIGLVQRLGLDHRRLLYEEFKDNLEVVEELLPWLVGQTGRLRSRLSKQNPDDLRQRVTNYAEVVAAAQSFGWDYWL